MNSNLYLLNMFNECLKECDIFQLFNVGNQVFFPDYLVLDLLVEVGEKNLH